MTDRIVYLVTESGMDGRGKLNVTFASFDKEERDNWLNSKGANKCYYSTAKRIIEIEHKFKQALAKLDGIDRLMLTVAQRK